VNSVFVLDACALLAVARNEEGANIVVEAYRKASSGKARILMNRVNLLEVYYDFYRHKGKQYAKDFVMKVKQSVVQIYEFDEAIFEEAGRLKASYKISLADSIALAQALVTGGDFLTADHHEFDAIEKHESIRFYWIR
jgi:PIN domain nuclease of toxin-antitoxin system